MAIKNAVPIVVEDPIKIAEPQGVTTMCCVCHQIKDDRDNWYQIETYLEKWRGVLFSHGYCPRCYKNEVAKIKRYTEA